MFLRERQRAQPQRRMPRQSPRMRPRVDKPAAKEAKLVGQEEQAAPVELQEVRAAATWDKCSAVCLRRRSPICKRAMR